MNRRKSLFPILVCIVTIFIFSSCHSSKALQGVVDVAPGGKTPFYINYYGTHGPAHLSHRSSYEAPRQVLAHADSLGRLTPLGQDVLRRVTLLSQEADGRWGELTAIGVTQQQEVARRMVERHPLMFKDSVKVFGRSLMTTRSLLSMESLLLQISRMCRYRVYHTASNSLSPYFFHYDAKVSNQVLGVFDADTDRLMATLFSDMAYVRDSVDAMALNTQLFRLAGNIQYTTLADRLTLDDLFTDEERGQNRRRQNVLDYVSYGNYAPQGERRPYVQPQLVSRLIFLTDSCLKLTTPVVDLHIGDETGLIPLVCQLSLDGYGVSTGDLGSLEAKGWMCDRIAPAGGNVQFVFYRNGVSDDDVLVRVLLNEREATLPVTTDVAPFYHWRDVRRHYVNIFGVYEEK